MRRASLVERITAIVLIGVVAVMISSCNGRSDRITLPETPVLFGRSRFALVVDAYARVYATPDRTAEIRTHLRRGDVLAIESRTPDETWIEIQRLDIQGWIESNGIRTFSSREQALNARQMLTQ